MRNTLTIALLALSVTFSTSAAFAERPAIVLLPELPGAAHGSYLGVGLRDITDDRTAQLKLKDARGVEVIAIDHDGPAAKAGIHEHDVILQLNGQDIASYEQMRRILRETPAGRKATLLLSRDGQELPMEVVLGERTALARVAMPDLGQLDTQLSEMSNVIPGGVGGFDSDSFEFTPLWSSGNAGVQVEALGPQLAQFFGVKDGGGVLVREVRPESAAAKAGIRAGDVILRAQDHKIASRSDWQHAVQSAQGKTLPVEVMRDHHQQRLTVAVPAHTQGWVQPDGLDSKQVQQQVQTAMADLQKQMASPSWKKSIADAEVAAQKVSSEWQANQAQIQKEIDEAVSKGLPAAWF